MDTSTMSLPVLAAYAAGDIIRLAMVVGSLYNVYCTMYGYPPYSSVHNTNAATRSPPPYQSSSPMKGNGATSPTTSPLAPLKTPVATRSSTPKRSARRTSGGKSGASRARGSPPMETIIISNLSDESPSGCGLVLPTPPQASRHMMRTPVSSASSGYPVNLKAWSPTPSPTAQPAVITPIDQASITRSLCGSLSAIEPPSRGGFDGRVIVQFFNGCLSSKNAVLALETYAKYKEEKMPRADPAINLQVVDKVVKVLAVKEQWEEICAIYVGDMRPLNLIPDSALCSLILSAAVRAGHHDLANALYKMYPSDDGDVGKQMAMIRSYGLQGDLASAVNLFHSLKADAGSQQVPSSLVYNCLLDAAVLCGDMNVVREVFDEMRGAGKLDVVSFNTVMKGYLKQGNMKQARRIMRDMHKAGLAPNLITYNELLHTLVQNKDRKGIWEVVDEMKRNRLPPNNVTCSILLKALTSHSHSSDVVRTMELVERMRGDMDEVLFSSVIEACIRIGKLDILSHKLQQYTMEGGLKGLTAPTYGSMIKAYGHAKDLRKVWSLWTEMRQRSVKPTAITLGCMVDALVTNRYPEDALALIHDMINTPDCADCVNTIVYSTVIKGFAMSKQVDRVFDVYQEMIGNNIALNTVSFNTIMDACARGGMMHRVTEIFRDMEAQGVEPDIITYSTIVKGYCLAGDVDTAFAVLRDMTNDGENSGKKKFAPDEIMYNSLLDGCAKQHRVEQALDLLEEMRSHNVAPSNYTLSILVKLLGRARRLMEAFNMVEDLCKAYDFRANVHVYTCLLQACVHNKQLQRAIRLHDAMVEEYRVDPDQKTYAVLARGCIYSNHLELASSVVRCAFGLSTANGMALCRKPPGMETRVAEEILAQIVQRGGNASAARLAAPLLHDLRRYRGLRITDTTVNLIMTAAAQQEYPHLPEREDAVRYEGTQNGPPPPPPPPTSVTLPPFTHSGGGGAALGALQGNPRYSPPLTPLDSPHSTSMRSMPTAGASAEFDRFQLPVAHHHGGNPFMGVYPTASFWAPVGAPPQRSQSVSSSPPLPVAQALPGILHPQLHMEYGPAVVDWQRCSGSTQPPGYS